jgi:hypothetical protein
MGAFRQLNEDVSISSKIKTPLDNPKEDQAWGGTFKWKGLKYVNFKPDSTGTCWKKDYALGTNDMVTDKYAIQLFEDITMENVDLAESIVRFKPLPDSLINVEKCGWFQCSADKNILL